MAKEFREHSVGLLTLLVVALAIYGLVRLNSHAAAAPPRDVSLAQATDIGASDQHLFGAVYTTTGGQTSTLGLNNSQNHPITAQVTLYNKHGAALAISPVTLGPHQNHAWDIADWVHGVGGGFEEGSLEVFYHDASMALGAQETITDANHSLSYDVHLQEPMDFMSSRADGLWWALDDNHDADVFIANTRATQTTVTPIFYIGGVAHEGEPITLNGHESDVIDIEKSLKKLHLSTSAIGGISLTYTNGPGGLAMVGVISNKHTGFSPRCDLSIRHRNTPRRFTARI